MQRQNVIILIQPGKDPICRGNFKKLCLEFDLPYHSLKMMPFPITHNNLIIYKSEFKWNTHKSKDLHVSDIFKEIKLKKNFPIKVAIEGGFYVIESKLNYDALL